MGLGPRRDLPNPLWQIKMLDLQPMIACHVVCNPRTAPKLVPHCYSRGYVEVLFSCFIQLTSKCRHYPYHAVLVTGQFIGILSQKISLTAPLSLFHHFSGSKGFYFSKYRPSRWERLQTNVSHDVVGAVELKSSMIQDWRLLLSWL